MEIHIKVYLNEININYFLQNLKFRIKLKLFIKLFL